MEIYQGILLGVLQGITEFLPVSSSGHLVLGQHFLKLTEPMLSFDISVHLGTLAAILIVFHKDIKQIFTSKSNARVLVFIGASCIPTAIFGLIIKRFEHTIFSSVLLVGVMLLITGTLLWMTRRVQSTSGNPHGFSQLTIKKSVYIGIWQGIAVIPGISRSGATISAGLFTKLDGKTAAKFSFLMSIPAIIGAELLQISSSIQQGFSITPATVYGMLASFITGWISLVLLLKIVNTGKLYIFAPYCWTVGAFVILYHMINLT